MLGHIIIDGPDAVGKTTLGEFIKDKFGFDIVHSGAEDPNDYKYHSDLLKSQEHKVYDRFMAGEFVYPRIYGRPAKLTATEMNKLFDEIVETNSLYIIMNTSNLDIVNERLIARNELDYLNEIKEQTELFTAFAGIIFEERFENHIPNFMYIDISKPDAYDKLYNYVEDFIKSNMEDDK